MHANRTFQTRIILMAAAAAGVLSGAVTHAGTVLSEDFDPAVDNAQWTSIQNGTATTGLGFLPGGGNALHFDGNGTRAATTKSLNVLTGGTISFDFRVANLTDAHPQWETSDEGEGITLSYSIDGGTIWSTLKYLEATNEAATYHNWTNVSAAIPVGALAANTLFRWAQNFHSGPGFDNWALDNVTIITLANGGTWANAAGGDWAVGANWSSGVAPTSADSAAFNLANTYAVSFAANADAQNLSFTGGGSVTFNLDGFTFTSGASTSVGGATNTTWRAHKGTVSIGGTLSVGNTGGTVGTVFFGENASAANSVIATAAGLVVGGAGTGTVNVVGVSQLQVSGDVSIARDAGSTGTLTVVDNNSKLTAGNVYIGGSAAGAGGTGTLNLSAINSAVVAGTTKIYSGGSLVLPASSSNYKTGSLDLGGVSSRLNWTAGSLEINNSDPTIATGGSLGTTQGIGTNKTLRVIDTPGGATTGTLAVGAGGSLSVTGGTIVTRSLDVATADAFTFTSGTITIDGGLLTPKIGPVTLESPAGPDTYPNALTVNGVTGSTARPTLRLQNGADYTNNADMIVIGNSGGRGTLALNGVGTTLATTSGASGYLYVGTHRSSTGTSGAMGLLSLDAGAAATVHRDILVGNHGGTGGISVSGAGTMLTSTLGELVVGIDRHIGGTVNVAGTGTLGVSGGELSVEGNITIGGYGGKGSVTASGATGLLESRTGELRVGYQRYTVDGASIPGDGSLILAAGAQVKAKEIIKIGTDGGFGNVIVGVPDDGGGAVLSGRILILGQASQGLTDAGGSLTVYPGGTVDIGGDLRVFNTSLVTLYGGTINTGSIAISSPSQFRWESGTLNITNSDFTIGPDGPLGPDLVLGPDKSLFVTGAGRRLIMTGDVAFAGASATVPNINSTGSLSLTEGAVITVVPAGDAAGVSKVRELDITPVTQSQPIGRAQTQSVITGYNGTLQLHDNDLVVNYTGGTTQYESVLAMVKSGIVLLGGNGTGIASSEIDSQLLPGTMLGVVDNGAVGGLVTNLSGYTEVPLQSVLVKYTWRGDANLDGVVNGSDYALADTGFSGGGTGWFYGDMNYDGIINGSDYALIDTGFSSQTGSLPEPASLSLLGLGAMRLLRRRRE